jgi:nucleoside-diphosphate-sugar epimerase
MGYTALFLACKLLGEGWKVSGTVRDMLQISRLRNSGVNGCVFNSLDNNHDASEFPLDEATHILSTIPPGVGGDPVCDLLHGCRKAVWLGYLSTTGVYGDTAGAIVDETAPPNPNNERSRRRVAAEEKWFDLHDTHSLPVHVFRLPSIYGPGRSIFDQYERNGLHRIDKPGHLFNRIHVDDIVQALQASMDKPDPGKIYNVSDDEPAAPSDVTAYACELMGVEPPPLVSFEQASNEMSAMALSFWHDNRRVSNERMKSELGVKLFHPDYRSGLKDIWNAKSRSIS